MSDDFLKIVKTVQSTGKADSNQSDVIQAPVETSKVVNESLDLPAKICQYGKDMSNETKRDSNN